MGKKPGGLEGRRLSLINERRPLQDKRLQSKDASASFSKKPGDYLDEGGKFVPKNVGYYKEEEG